MWSDKLWFPVALSLWRTSHGNSTELPKLLAKASPPSVSLLNRAGDRLQVLGIC